MSPSSNPALLDQFVQSLTEAVGGREKARQFEVAFDGKRSLDALISVSIEEGDWTLAVEMLGQGYPRDVREAVWQLEEFQLRSPKDKSVIPMVVAEHLSSGARESLRERNIGYFDGSGTLYLKHGRWFINIDREAKPRATRRLNSLFTGAREQVVHALLHHHPKWLTGVEIAKESETSTFTASTVLQELERLEWLESTGSGRTLRRRLARPAELLDAWAAAWTKRKDKRSRWYVFASNPKALMMHITWELEQSPVEGDWAFTGTAAANVLSPLLTSVDSAEVIAPLGATDRFAQAMKLKPAEKGSNVTLIERGGASLLFRDRHPEYPSWFASRFILYLDLLDGRGRNKELAQQLRHDILKI